MYAQETLRFRRRYLLIQLGAMGDVVRTTALLRRWRADDPNAHITWVTDYPELLPTTVDCVLRTSEAPPVLEGEDFHVVVNPDKDVRACGLMRLVLHRTALHPRRAGFMRSRRGSLVPVNDGARHVWQRGFDNDYARAHQRSYVEELFELAEELPWAEEASWLPEVAAEPPCTTTRPIVALAPGCGARWPQRSPDVSWWAHVAEGLVNAGYQPIVLTAERSLGQAVAGRSGWRCEIADPVPPLRFLARLKACQAVVSPVSLAAHLAMGLGRPLILLNNVFNKAEFRNLVRGEILEPEPACAGACFYRNACQAGRRCANDIAPARVVAAVTSWITTVI